jgi:hypothetical protein
MLTVNYITPRNRASNDCVHRPPASAISRRFSEVSVAVTATRPVSVDAFEFTEMQIADPKTLHQKRTDLRLSVPRQVTVTI